MAEFTKVRVCHLASLSWPVKVSWKHVCRWSELSLVQVMSWCLIGAKQLPKSAMVYHQLGLQEQTVEGEILIKMWYFRSTKCILFEPFCPGLDLFNLMMTSSNGSIFRVTGHLCQWRGALMFSLICAWINNWENNCEAGDSRHYHAHYDVIVMYGKMDWYCMGMKIMPPLQC